jgi:hypothetical protein
VALLGAGCAQVGAQNIHLEASKSIAEGVHLWYEIKADPEDSRNLIICGTKWDALTNGPYGFVYASSDSGSTWQAVLEDRNTAWVTEHSCAFGLRHRAYFISEASKVFDGQPHHNLGVTRLYVSVDAGEHWIETKKTGWADFSTSAVSGVTGRLYTFFNNPSTKDPGRNRGGSVGLLVFSPDGTHVEGSFLPVQMRDRDYRDAYPSSAVALNSGCVVALYYGVRQAGTDLEEELGLLRADASPEPSFELTVIPRSGFEKGCLGLTNYSLAYDRERNRLFILYVEGCKATRMMLTFSDDEGKTWSKSIVVAEQGDRELARHPSLVARPGGVLGLLWSERNDASVRWFFAQIRDEKFVAPPIELPGNAGAFEVGNDSLWTTIHRPKEAQNANRSPLGPPIVVGVRSLVDVVWRASGLIAMGDKTFAIWPSSGIEGMRLNWGVLEAAGPRSASINKNPAGSNERENPDVTQHSVLTYGGRQTFDQATETLTVCLVLSNRGNDSIGVPIHLEAESIEFPSGDVSILNATNGLVGPGARWDISDSVTGDRLAPGTTTSPFCLSVRMRGISRRALLLNENLVDLRLRVLAGGPKSIDRGSARIAVGVLPLLTNEIEADVPVKETE